MSNEKQLAKYREDFCKAFPARHLSASHQAVTDSDYVFAGYLRAKQETEQAMKLAKFGAMVIRDDSNGSIDKRELLQYAILADVISPNIEAAIEELLK